MSTRSDRPIPPPDFTEPSSIGYPGSHPLSPPSDLSSGTTSHGACEGPKVENMTQIYYEKRVNSRAQGESHGRTTTINILPDDVLLEIFDSYRKNQNPIIGYPVWEWHILAHVCRRWRHVIFGSPWRLDLELLCTNGTPVRKTLDCWPPFPIVVDYKRSNDPNQTFTPQDEDSFFAVLEHPDRIRYIGICETGSQLRKVVMAMQEPVPLLTHLDLWSEDENAPVLPSGFLGGSAPSLQGMRLEGIPFPSPTLLLSTSDLVNLFLSDIPEDGYISPETMVACLAVLPALELLHIGFRSPMSPSGRVYPPPVARVVLPALTDFEFSGASEYLGDLVSLIDSPQLNKVRVSFRNQFADIQVAQLFEFIDRSEDPELTLFGPTNVVFSSRYVSFDMSLHHRDYQYWGPVRILVSCRELDLQVSRITQVFIQFSALLSNVVHLKLVTELDEADEFEDTDEVEWPDLLRQFSAMKTLCVSQELAESVALTLEDIAWHGMAAEVLPAVELIFLGGQPVSFINNFVAVRQLSGLPVTIVDTETEFDERLKSYASE
ncbi:hypothetical protein EDB89DRAFT_2229396 [Lactarius sanguifluus]|nr:hypothetical protein EDB89DRAFT_2229396 [Lactarius sanguifluus]